MSRSYEDGALKYLKDFANVGHEVKRIIIGIDPDARVYVFGSVVKGKYTASSDIDILVVTTKFDERHRMLLEVYKKIEAPVELHVTTPEKFDSWYKRFINEDEIAEVV